MQLNLLFLPLLGGFIFYMKWNGTRYHAARSNGQRLLLNSAAFGLGLLILARSLVMTTPSLARQVDVSLEISSFLVIGCATALILSLLFIYYDSTRDPELRDALELEKRAAGLLIAASALTALMLAALRIDKTFGPTFSLSALYALAVILGVIAVAQLIRHNLRRLDPNLYGQYRVGALSFRVSILLLFLAEILAIWVLAAGEMELLWNEFSVYAQSGTPFLACMIGALAWWPLNLLFPHDVSNARLHRTQQTNSLERLLYAAALESSLVMLTMKDGKVYIGWIANLPPDPASSDACLRFLPSMSGYRDKDTKRLVLTTFYDEAYEVDGVDLEDFIKVVPISNIDSAGKFREDVYLTFLDSRPSPPGRPQSTTPPDAATGEPRQNKPPEGTVVQNA